MTLKNQLKYQVYPYKLNQKKEAYTARAVPFKTLNLQDMAECISSGDSGLKLNPTLMVLERFVEELEKAAIEGNEFRHEVLSMQHVIKPGICIRESIT